MLLVSADSCCCFLVLHFYDCPQEESAAKVELLANRIVVVEGALSKAT